MSTNAVAKRAGVSVGSLYQYFSNKEALYAAMIERQLDEARKALEIDEANALGPPVEAVARQLIERLIQAHRVNLPLHRALIALAPRVGMLQAQNALTQDAITRVELWLRLNPQQLHPGRDPHLAAWMTCHAVERIIAETTRMVVGFLKP
ncbi:MAG: AcrR family transcriptional regulator [Myxococcota bacterium]|jgi:AcrR family transcriptional regulator